MLVVVINMIMQMQMMIMVKIAAVVCMVPMVKFKRLAILISYDVAASVGRGAEVVPLTF